MSSIQDDSLGHGSVSYGAVSSPYVENGHLRFDSNLKILQKMLQDILSCGKGNSRKQNVGGEVRKDSGIEVDYVEKTHFVNSCSKEFDRLFEFINEVLTHVKSNSKRQGYNSVLIGVSKPLLASLDYETDLNELLTNAIETLQNIVMGLGQLLRECDEQSGDNDGDALIRKKKKEQNALKRKLMRALSDVDKRKEERLVMKQSKKEYFGYSYWSMMLLLVACALVVCGFEFPHLNPFECTRWTILLRVVRSPLMVAFYCFLVGFNMMAWSRTGINYPRLFSFPRKGMPTPRIMFNAGSVLTIIVAVHLVVYLFLAEYFYIADKAIGISIWVCFVIFLLNPFKIFIRSGRFILVYTFLRMVISPLADVSFSDVWFADQMNSLVNVMVDIEDFIYHLFENSWTKNVICGPKTPVHYFYPNLLIRAVLFSLPALWRLLQCLRVAYVEKRYIQIVNAFKYSTTLLLVIMSTLYTYFIQYQDKCVIPKMAPGCASGFELREWVIFVLLCFSALLKCFYCFFWDIFYDWHLFRCTGRDCPRSKLFFRKRWYYLATIFNFIVRFAGAMRYFYGIAQFEDGGLTFTVLAVSEVTRRFVWNYFRVEWEHIDNTGSTNQLEHNNENV